MAWIELIIAGLFEVVWASTMKLSHGFTKVNFALLTLVGMIASFYFLAKASKVLPLSMAYPIWTGVGAVGSILVGWLIFKESISPVTWLFIALLVIGIIGIKVSSGH